MIKSFLMIGQSNMAGRGFIKDVPAIYNERIQMLRNGRWQMMTEPINYDRPVAGVSLAGTFAARWCIENPEDNIGLIPCAEGGSSIDDWAIEKPLFKHAISEAKFAMENSELAGILWHQGESDSYGGNYKTYYEKLHIIVETLRKELNAPDIPLIIGGLGDFLGKSGFGENCTEYTLVNAELQKFANEHENCYFVTAEDLSSNPDGIHMNAVSLRRFGIRYFEAFSKKQNVLTPIENENELIDSCYTREYTKSEKMYIEMMGLALGEMTYDEFATKLTGINRS